MLKINFTFEEAGKYMQAKTQDNDMVRLVNPISQRVYKSDFSGFETSLCSDIWGHCQRCENCTSMKALNTKGRAYKLEVLPEGTFLVQSRYILIDEKPYVVETVNDVSNTLIMDSTKEDEIGKLITSYNHQLITDSLTGLYNRRFLDDNLIPSMQCCRDQGMSAAICIMDFDDFKMVNDTYGHMAGDALLKDVAGFWMHHFHSREKNNERIVIRYGGDEMLIFACHMTGEELKAEVELYYSQMRKVCYFGDDIQIPFTISFGIASSEELGASWVWEELLDIADRRMYKNKNMISDNKDGN